jgi:transglutaminase-like putative cysteine protease
LALLAVVLFPVDEARRQPGFDFAKGASIVSQGEMEITMTKTSRLVSVLALSAGIAAAAAPPVALLAGITAEKYPDANAVIVFDSTVVTLQADGRNVTRQHKLVKILTEKGKKRYATSFNSYSLTYSKVDIRLARTITPQGRVLNVPKKDILDVPMPLWEGSKFVLPNVRVKSIQFPGLELGSAVEWISEDITHNPVMEGQFDAEVLFESGDPMVSTAYTIDAPAAMEFRWLVKSGSVDTAFTTRGARQRMTWSAHDVPRVIHEPMMPYAASLTRLLVCTQPDWQTWSRWYYDLCSTRYEIDSALARAIDSLTGGATTEDAKVRALYNFVNQKIRYVETALSGKKGGYQPEKISLTYQKRYGVCRDKAALLTGILRHVGVDAYITLTNRGSRTDGELPVDQFNHATVAVKRADGSIYYLDPTVENSRQYYPASETNRGVLLATEEGADLRYAPLSPADSNRLEVRIDDTLRPDGSLVGAAELTPIGQQELRLRALVQYLPPEQEKQVFERYLRVFGPGARLDTITMTDPCELNQPLVIKFRFTVGDFATVLKPRSSTGSRRPTIRFTLPKSGNGMFPVSIFRWASSMPVRKYDVDFRATQAWHMVHAMTLPRGFRTVLVPDSLVQSFDKFEASSTTRAEKNRLVNEAWFRLKEPLVPVAEYQDLRDLLAATEEIERQHVMLKPSEE